MNKKTYLFISDTNYETGNQTGAHKRFLELIKYIAKTENVVLVSRKIPQLEKCKTVNYLINSKESKILPSHINGMLSICKVLKEKKMDIKYDYCISFSPTDSLCYKMCGYDNIVSLFREDYIGYKRIIGVSKIKILYFKIIERIAVKASKKIIVQCNDDRDSLIRRNKKYVKNINQLVFVQPNNVNASWMNLRDQRTKKNYSDEANILFIGNFSNKRKGHSILLPAIKRLLLEGYNIKLYVAGSGKDLDKYKKEYSDYPQIIFLGDVRDMQNYILKSDFEVVPSYMDSCPNTVLEGLNAGLTVYGSNVGGIKEMLVDNDFLFETNEESVYNFLREKINKRSYINDSIRQKAIKRRLSFNWSEKIKQIIDK